MTTYPNVKSPRYSSKQIAALRGPMGASVTDIGAEMDTLFEGGLNPLTLPEVGRRDARWTLDGPGNSAESDDLFLVRRGTVQKAEVFGPVNIPAGGYPVRVLYGITRRPEHRFLLAIEELIPRVETIIGLNPEGVEYSHQTALLWAGVGNLKEFLKLSGAVAELVAELRTARFQFIGKDTPPCAIKSLLKAFQEIRKAPRCDTGLVDRIVAILEVGGVDPLALDALRTDA